MENNEFNFPKIELNENTLNQIHKETIQKYRIFSFRFWSVIIIMIITLFVSIYGIVLNYKKPNRGDIYQLQSQQIQKLSNEIDSLQVHIKKLDKNIEENKQTISKLNGLLNNFLNK